MVTDQNIQNFINLCKKTVSEDEWRELEYFYKKDIESINTNEETYKKNNQILDNIIGNLFTKLKYNPILLKLLIETIEPKVDQFIILNSNSKDLEDLKFNFVLKIISSFPESRYKLIISNDFVNPIFSHKEFDVLNLYKKIIYELKNNNYRISHKDLLIKVGGYIDEAIIMNIKGVTLENGEYRLKSEMGNLENKSKINGINLESSKKIKNNSDSSINSNSEIYKIPYSKKLKDISLKEHNVDQQKIKHKDNKIEEYKYTKIDKTSDKKTVSSNNIEELKEISKIELNPNKFLIIYKTNSGFWVNEFIKKEKYSGNTNRGFGINITDTSKFIELIEDTIKNHKENRLRWVGSNSSQLVISKGVSTIYKEKNYIDLRKFINTKKYAGYTKKGIRLLEDEFLKFFTIFKEIIKN